jgi:hypothetical protein
MENRDQGEKESHLESQELESLHIQPWNKLEVTLVGMSIYIFCANLLGPIISGISE